MISLDNRGFLCSLYKLNKFVGAAGSYVIPLDLCENSLSFFEFPRISLIPCVMWKILDCIEQVLMLWGSPISWVSHVEVNAMICDSLTHSCSIILPA